MNWFTKGGISLGRRNSQAHAIRFLYPEIGDRCTIDEWKIAGEKDIYEVALEKTREIPCSHFPRHVSPEIDQQLRSNFDVRLSETAMRKARRHFPPNLTG